MTDNLMIAKHIATLLAREANVSYESVLMSILPLYRPPSDKDNLTYEQIGNLLSTSKQRVNQVEELAMRKLSTPSRYTYPLLKSALDSHYLSEQHPPNTTYQ